MVDGSAPSSDDAVAMLRRDAAPSATAAAVVGGGVESTALTDAGSVGSEAGWESIPELETLDAGS